MTIKLTEGNYTMIMIIEKSANQVLLNQDYLKYKEVNDRRFFGTVEHFKKEGFSDLLTGMSLDPVWSHIALF